MRERIVREMADRYLELYGPMIDQLRGRAVNFESYGPVRSFSFPQVLSEDLPQVRMDTRSEPPRNESEPPAPEESSRDRWVEVMRSLPAELPAEFLEMWAA